MACCDFKECNPWRQFLFLSGMIVLSMLLTVFSVQVLSILFFGRETYNLAVSFIGLSDSSVLNAALFMQALSQIGLFIVPSVIFIAVSGYSFREKLGLRGVKIWPDVLFAGALVFLALPFVMWLFEINNSIHFPESMSALENWMRNAEEKAEEITLAFVSVSSLSGLGVNLFVIAIIPAIAEELLFRGVLQNLISRLTGRKVLAVWITAFLFSLIHMQFFGFIPRFFLGLIMGYLYLWSGSLWLPIAAHFANNAGAVLAGWLFAAGYSDVPFEEVGHAGGGTAVIISLISTIALLMYLRLRRAKHNKEYIVDN